MKIIMKDGSVEDIQVIDADGNNLIKSLAIHSLDIHIESGKAPSAILHCYASDLNIGFSDINMVHRIHNRETMVKNGLSRIN